MLFNGPNKKLRDPRYFLHEGDIKTAFSDQEKLAQQSGTQREYARCPFAKKIQQLILAKVNITDPVLIKKLSDGKFGFVTASAVNRGLEFAKRNNIDVGQLTPIPLNRAGYSRACDLSQDKINKFVEVFNSISAREVQNFIKADQARAAVEQQKLYDQGKTDVTPQQIAAMNASINTFKDSDAEEVRKAIATNSPYLAGMLRAVPEEARKKYNLPPAPPLPKSEYKSPEEIKRLMDTGELNPF